MLNCGVSAIESFCGMYAGSCEPAISTRYTPGGATISTDRVPDTPPTVAVIVATPADTPVTTPAPVTLATAALLVVHVTGQPLAGAGPLADTLAVNVLYPLTRRLTVRSCGEIVTALTTDVVPPEAVDTATVELAVFEPAVAEIVVEPGATAVTSPAPSTVAIAGLADAQVTSQPPEGVVPTVVSDGTIAPWAPGAR